MREAEDRSNTDLNSPSKSDDSLSGFKGKGKRRIIPSRRLFEESVSDNDGPGVNSYVKLPPAPGLKGPTKLLRGSTVKVTIYV